jgi:hypothetical protein
MPVSQGTSMSVPKTFNTHGNLGGAGSSHCVVPSNKV